MASDVIPCLLRRRALAHPEAIAVRDGSRSISYRDLDTTVRMVERKFASLGVRGGDRVAILAGNSLAYVTSIFALFRLGAAAVPLNQRWPMEMLRDSITRSESMLVLFDMKFKHVADRLGVISHLIDDLTSREPGTHDLSGHVSQTEIQADRIVTIVFTSGSSGPPKGVMLTYGNHYHNALASNDNISFGVGDCWLASLPFCHVGGLGVLFRAALSGGSVSLSPGWDAEGVSERIDRGELTHISVVPTMLDALVRARSGKPFPPTLKSILIGGASPPIDLLESAASLAAPIRTSYGMTEATSQICTLPKSFLPDSLRSAGKPLSCCELKIVDERGNQTPAGVSGEIAIRGKSTFAGYVGVDRHRTFDNAGWFLTGDIGEIDSDGFLYVRGRKNEMIISGGENMYPEQIELVVAAVNEIANCAVIGVNHPTWGERPVLCYTVVPGSTLSESELRNRIAKRLSKLFVPDKFVRLDAMPLTAIGKIDRAALRAIYGRSLST